MSEHKKTIDFGYRIAKAMNDIRSSNVFFVLQQAYPDRDEWEWSDFQRLLNEIMEENNA